MASGRAEVARVLSFPVGSVEVGELPAGLWKASLANGEESWSIGLQASTVDGKPRRQAAEGPHSPGLQRLKNQELCS